MHTFKDLVLNHMKRYPEAQVRDIYKLIFQGVYGVKHLFIDKAWDVLKEETDRINVDDYPHRALFDDVNPMGSMVRVNLRPFLRRNLSLEKLFNVMKKTSEHRGEPQLFLEYWREFSQMVTSGVLPLNVKDLEVIEASIKQGIKPMHHTQRYREAYYPAYRVVDKTQFEKEFKEDSY